MIVCMGSRRTIWFYRSAGLVVVAMSFVWPVVAFSVFLTWVIYVFATGTYYQSYQGRSLERGLGFKHGKLYERVGWLWHSALAIRSVTDGGILSQAGFQTDDVVSGWSFTGFFRHLHRNRGRIVELEVIDGGEGPPFQTRPRRTLRFAVPTVSDAPPTRSDALVAISIWYPLIFLVAGGTLGLLLCRAILPDSPLWGQLLAMYSVASIGCHIGGSIAEQQTQSTRPETRPN